MKYVKTTHYVESSFGEEPSFVVQLEDKGIIREFVSNGKLFKENTSENYHIIVRHFGCDTYIEELLRSPVHAVSEIRDACNMFYNADVLTDIELSLPSATHCHSLLADCTSLRGVKLSLPRAMECDYLLWKCQSLGSIKLSLPEAIECGYLLSDSDSLKSVELSLPKAIGCDFLLSECPLLESVKLLSPRVTDCYFLLGECTALKDVELLLPRETDCDYLLQGANLTLEDINISYL